MFYIHILILYMSIVNKPTINEDNHVLHLQ